MTRKARVPECNLCGDEAAVSEIVGNVILVGITVLLAAALSAAVATFDGPRAIGTVQLAMDVDAGSGGWGTGDEEIRVHHVGGIRLAAEDSTIRIDLAGTPHVFSGLALGGPFSDGELSIGETWAYVTTMSQGTAIGVNYVHETDAGTQLVGTTRTMSSGGRDCTADIDPPTVSHWATVPADIDVFTPGAVDVTVTLVDDCSGPDPSVAPRLHHRIVPSVPTFQDDGPMTFLGSGRFQGRIPDPDPVNHWTPYLGETVEYKVVLFSDAKGNIGNSTVQSDAVNSVAMDTYPDAPPTIGRGTVLAYENAQNADDGGAQAQFIETAVMTPTVNNIYATSATSESGASTPASHAQGAPDSNYVVLEVDGERIRTQTFAAGAGTITKVELAFRGMGQGTRVDDLYEFRYRLSGNTQSCNVPGGCFFAAPSTETTSYVDITSDRAWTWGDVTNIEPRVEYEKVGSNDAGYDIWVNALWVRVTSQQALYGLNVTTTFTDVPIGFQYNLQIRYQTGGTESFRVEVYQPATATWVQRGPLLSSSTVTDWLSGTGYQLTSNEYNGGDPRVRFTDFDPSGNSQGQLNLDFFRIHTG